MALTVRTNVGALSAIKTLNSTQNSLTKSLGRVSSGSRINKAGDDAVGLSVSSRMKSDNVSLKAAMRNTNDGISLIQTVEGSLNEVYNILTRMRELAVQGANDTYSATDRNQIQIEFQPTSPRNLSYLYRCKLQQNFRIEFNIYSYIPNRNQQCWKQPILQSQ